MTRNIHENVVFIMLFAFKVCFSTKCSLFSHFIIEYFSLSLTQHSTTWLVEQPVGLGSNPV